MTIENDLQFEKEIEINNLQFINLSHKNVEGMSRITQATAFILYLWIKENQLWN